MKVALQTGTLSPHQLPLAREIVKRVGAENYRYIYTQAIDTVRKSFGWSDAANEPWCISIRAPEAREWIETCDVLIESFRDCDLIERRAKKGLRTWYCNERWFKPLALGIVGVKSWRADLPGSLRMLVPSYRKMARRFVKLVNQYDCVGVLAIGPWSAADFVRLGVRPEKIVPWGYFVEKGSGGMLAGRGGVGQRDETTFRVLWAGRDLPWKRAKDVEKAVTLANAFQPFRFTKLTGVRSEAVRQAMREHDVFVLASTAQEGWGAVVNEALEEGMSVLGTFEAGASAALLPKARLYHAGDVKALAELLEKERRGLLPPCSIGEWSAAQGAERFLRMNESHTDSFKH